MFQISANLSIPEGEIELRAIRAQGAGGQHVNKVSSAICLSFDIRASSLPEFLKNRLLALSDSRITCEGTVIIKAQQHRSQEMNRQEAFERLRQLILSVARTPKTRRPTKPTQSARTRRLEKKTLRGRVKTLRAKVTE